MSYVHDIAKRKGLEIVDATKPATVKVTPSDIEKAKSLNSKQCAFARAALKEPGVMGAYFFRSIAFIEYRDCMVRFALPQKVRDEITTFDRAGFMEPGRYVINPIQPSVTKEGQAAYIKNVRSPRMKERRAAKKAGLVAIDLAVRRERERPGLPRTARAAPPAEHVKCDPPPLGAWTGEAKKMANSIARRGAAAVVAGKRSTAKKTTPPVERVPSKPQTPNYARDLAEPK